MGKGLDIEEQIGVARWLFIFEGGMLTKANKDRIIGTYWLISEMLAFTILEFTSSSLLKSSR